MSEPVVNIGSNIILEKDGKVLLGKRLNSAGAGDWGFPGGHVELGETFKATITRELLEEIGLTVKNLDFLGIVNQPHQESGKHYLQIVFSSKDFEGELTNLEPEFCEEWKWFDLNALPENIFYAHKDFLSLKNKPGSIIETK
ncbi:MAG TPA: NUDIX domain-containing protein [Patescibacteria group bacterium]|jgi:8-oxo-dGTP diphosphatase|nr:NUDIX domain-containing protein [Patescibacteria group bacterium]